MEIRNHTTSMAMRPSLIKMLEIVRQERSFDAESWISKKIYLLNEYYRQANLKSAVIAVSGGIDSAVVLGLVKKASEMPDSPIENVVAITMPDHHNPGVTGQSRAKLLADKVCESFEIESITLDISLVTETIVKTVERMMGGPSNEKFYWCRGQATSYARTPVYYYLTSLLASQGKPGLVIGTTNLSEGGFLGYFGKASDGMVDVQLISDLFKSEVYEVGRVLGVPQEVLDREPTGDMFDATPDEVVFGAPYDFVEIYTHMLWSPLCALAVEDTVADDPEAVRQFNEYKENLERMRAYNAHKYLGRSPAVHLDVLECHVIGGWDNKAWRPQ